MSRRKHETKQQFVWRRGVHLPGTELWCDARRAQRVCFVSGAFHLAAGHSQMIATPTSLSLLRENKPEHLGIPLRKRFTLGVHQLELVPSGAGLGAAALVVRSPTRSVLYCKSPRMHDANAFGERAEIKPVDAICLDSDSGLAASRFTATHLLSAMAAHPSFPIVLQCPYAINALEVMLWLASHGHPFAVSKQVSQWLADAQTAEPSRTQWTLIADAIKPPRETRVSVVHSVVKQPKPKVVYLTPNPSLATLDDYTAAVTASGAKDIYISGHAAGVITSALGKGTILAPPAQMLLFATAGASHE